MTMTATPVTTTLSSDDDDYDFESMTATFPSESPWWIQRLSVLDNTDTATKDCRWTLYKTTMDIEKATLNATVRLPNMIHLKYDSELALTRYWDPFFRLASFESSKVSLSSFLSFTTKI